MIPYYNEKLLYLYRHQKGRCAISGKVLERACKTDLHHGFHNTKWARKKYPLFINSLFNLFLVDHDAHMQNPGACRINELQAEKYERFLEKHPKWQNLVNKVDMV